MTDFTYTPRPQARYGTNQSLGEARERLQVIARLLDSAIAIPGTSVRIGFDAVLNLIPGVGTMVAKGLAGYLIYEARRLGVPTGTLLRMVGNVAVDFVLSAIPVVGWVGDVFYRANTKNIDLLNRHLDRLAPPRFIDGVARPA